MTPDDIRQELDEYTDGKSAEHVKRYFKTGPGEYGEGDVFLGVKVPHIRKLAGKHRAELSPDDLEQLLLSDIHEIRYFALVVMKDLFSGKNAGKEDRRAIFDLYMKKRDRVNNWDLVDMSAPGIAGAWLYGEDRSILFDLARSGVLWDRRISIVATLFFIRNHEFGPTLSLAGILLNDKEDLIHKAVGWMLREIGKRDFTVLEDFMQANHKKMPRTMLRYAIEKYPEPMRRAYLKG
ncbi:MAG: DNA alkylation repair protein [Thermodesulfobacteriota bacterium]